MFLLGLRSTKRAVCSQCTGLLGEADSGWDGKDSGGNIEGLSTPENDHWRAQAPARKYSQDAAAYHILTADLYVH